MECNVERIASAHPGGAAGEDSMSSTFKPSTLNISLVCAALAMFAALTSPAQQNTPSGASEPSSKDPLHIWTLPEDLEVRWAVSALPPSLRDQAGIRVLSNNRYVEYRKASNPFTYIVSRRAGNLYPV